MMSALVKNLRSFIVKSRRLHEDALWQTALRKTLPRASKGIKQ